MSSERESGQFDPLDDLGPEDGIFGQDADSLDKPTARVLRVIECLALAGPLTLDDLSQRLDVSKTAAWRLVAQLRDGGWVRLKQGNRLIELHHRIDEIFSRASFSDEEFFDLCERLPEVATDMGVHVDFFTLANDGSVELTDTTRRWRGDRSVLMEALDEETLLVMRSAMTGSVLARHLAAWELDEAARKPMGARTAITRFPTMLWSHEACTLSLGLRGSNGTPGALRISGRRRRLRRADARRLVRMLTGQLQALVDFMETSQEQAA
jgi:biotin operon repressor